MPPSCERRPKSTRRSGSTASPEKKLEVIFVAPPPVFKAPPFRCSDWFNAMNPICVGRNQQSRSELESLRKPIVDTMASLAKAFPNVRIWDPFPILCPGDICGTQHDGRPLFFDGDHLSGYGNMLLYPYFARAIASIPDYIGGLRFRTTRAS